MCFYWKVGIKNTSMTGVGNAVFETSNSLCSGYFRWSGFDDDIPAIMYPVVIDGNGTFRYKRKDCSGLDPIHEDG